MSQERYPTITIDLTLDRSTAKDVVHGVLHAILFHRLFGIVKPQTFEILDVTLPGVSDPNIEKLVYDKVGVYWRGIDAAPNKRGQIIVTFSEKRPKKSWFQVYMGEEEVPWEKWIINTELKQPKTERDRQDFSAELSAALRRAVMTMLTHTSSDDGRAAVPLITNQDLSPFPLRIAICIGGEEIG
ncbi:DUF1649-domain-containing protein [Fistulina hepatica ATCC 64428]|uniref:Autophagy-related protein 101 n=1 Tax=Fistulina hepatica ATCC 64428 TaxID=1128425 RepID=A0A0D7AMS5_9AGAR|nr:DUF1649-domain-containing protein [Fistulina hepatica ATCC 64428]